MLRTWASLPYTYILCVFVGNFLDICDDPKSSHTKYLINMASVVAEQGVPAVDTTNSTSLQTKS